MTVTTNSYRFDQIEAQLDAAPHGRGRLFRETDFQSLLKARLDNLLEGERILSLDVFDTLILRDNSSEITRFFEIGREMAAAAQEATGDKIAQVDAFVARYLGTKATYRASKPVRGFREGSLSELHKTASKILVGSNALTDAFVEAEINYESTRIQLNPFLVPYVEEYKAAGGKVVLVTDMYMHANHVKLLLEKLGLTPSVYDHLISSADTKVSKASGGIFSIVEKTMQATAQEFVHLGDSLRGDFQQPLRRGWSAVHLPLSKFDILERRQDHLNTQEVLASKYALSLDIAMPH